MNSDVDHQFIRAIKILHSSESAEKIRLMLDEIIHVSIAGAAVYKGQPYNIPSLPQARYGPSKTLANTLNKKYLAEEKASAPAVPATTAMTAASISSKSSSEDSNSMEVAYEMALVGDGKEQLEDVDKYKELEELFCATCGDVHTSIRNQLVECSDCHSLYHQECHKPPIHDTLSQWQCSKCKANTPIESVLTSSSSSSSSPTVFAMAKTSSSSSPHSSSSSSSSKSASQRKSGGGGSSSLSKSISSSGTGSGSNSKTSGGLSNILADKRLANMKKKAKMQKTK